MTLNDYTKILRYLKEIKDRVNFVYNNTSTYKGTESAIKNFINIISAHGYNLDAFCLEFEMFLYEKELSLNGFLNELTQQFLKTRDILNNYIKDVSNKIKEFEKSLLHKTSEKHYKQGGIIYGKSENIVINDNTLNLTIPDYIKKLKEEHRVIGKYNPFTNEYEFETNLKDGDKFEIDFSKEPPELNFDGAKNAKISRSEFEMANNVGLGDMVNYDLYPCYYNDRKKIIKAKQIKTSLEQRLKDQQKEYKNKLIEFNNFINYLKISQKLCKNIGELFGNKPIYDIKGILRY